MEFKEWIKSFLFDEWTENARFKASILMAMLVAVALAFAYIQEGMQLVGTENFSVIDSYAFLISIVVGSLIPLQHIIVFQDISEGLAIFSVMFWSLHSGFQDIMVYMFLGQRPVSAMTWLNDSLFIGPMADLLNLKPIFLPDLAIISLVYAVPTLAIVTFLYKWNPPNFEIRTLIKEFFQSLG